MVLVYERMETMIRYVVGFLFNGDLVALIQKNRPEWQKGKLNGIGGHIEDGESAEVAMVREFQEETGGWTLQSDWRKFALLTNAKKSVELHLFTNRNVVPIKTTTDEMVAWYPVNYLPDNIIPNLRWLIPMAKHENTFMADIVFDTDMW